jgi:hypothetical protein
MYQHSVVGCTKNKSLHKKIIITIIVIIIIIIIINEKHGRQLRGATSPPSITTTYTQTDLPPHPRTLFPVRLGRLVLSNLKI